MKLAIPIFLVLVVAIVLFLVFGMKKEQFITGEHQIVGDGDAYLKYDSLNLFFPATPSGTPSKNYPITLPNGISVTFGKIIAMAGDYFGIPAKPISHGKTLGDMQQRFVDAYNNMSQPSGDKFGKPAVQIPKILKISERQIHTIDKALSSGKNPSDVTKKLTLNIGEVVGDSLEYATATGGISLNPGCNPVNPLSMQYWKCVVDNISKGGGRFTELAKQNFDHYSANNKAWNAYWAGHTTAMTVASSARKFTNTQPDEALRLLEQAYAMDAFACHFLSDMFASGHSRLPRDILASGPKNYSDWNATIGGLLSLREHDDENKSGLILVNNACSLPETQRAVPCKKWVEYGDRFMSDKKSAVGRELQRACLQQSIKEVWDSFRLGSSQVDKSIVWQHVPVTQIMNNPLLATTPEVFEYKGIGIGSWCSKPASCLDKLGPEWRETSYDVNLCKRTCSRTDVNPTPLFAEYNGDLYRRKTGLESIGRPANSMTKVESELSALLTYPPFL